MSTYFKQLETKEQTYHLEGPYAHFLVTPQCIKHYKKELMMILQMTPEKMNVLRSEKFYDILCAISDYPVMNRPYSTISHHIIRDEQPGNPYNVITQIPQFMKKLNELFQYGVDCQPIGKDMICIYHHNRYTHSLDTACNIELIMRNNGFSEHEIKKAIIAGCLHDIATPAFGDLTMKAFPQLKEEQGFSAYMNHYPKLAALIQSTFDVSLEELQARIKNEGPVGKIIDVADRLAYTARDAFVFAGYGDSPHEHDLSFGKNVQNIVKEDPYLFDMIMEISVQDDQIIFENTERLKKFLLMRANMHNLIYLNPYLWSREEYFGLILQYLVEEGHLTVQQLQKGINDRGMSINEFVIDEFRQKNIIDHDPVTTYEFFDMHVHDTKEATIADMQALRQQLGSSIPVHHLKTPAFKPGTHYLVRYQGKVQFLSDVLQAEDLLELQTLSKATDKYLVLYPKEEYRNNCQTHPKLYTFLCRKAQEAYEKLIATS